MASEMVQSISVAMDTTSYKSMSGVKVTKISIQPENLQTIAVTQNSTSDVYFQITPKPNSFLNGMNSYMSFTYTYVGTAPIAAGTLENCNGSSNFISALEVTAGSTSLESISNYNVLAATLDDFQPKDRGATLCSILQDKDITNIKRGNARPIATLAAAGFTEERRICVPLISSVIGCMAEKYLPMGGRDIGLRVRMTMADPIIALKLVGADTSVGYTLKDVTLEMEYLEVSPSIYQTLASETGDGIFKISGVGISNFSNTGLVGTTQQNMLIPARYSSVRNFLTVNRPQFNLNNKWANTTGSRTRDNISSFLYRIGGQSYPSMAVSCDNFTSAECLTEVIKTFHAHADLNMNVCFNRDDFVKNVTVVPSQALTNTGESVGAFVMGIDFEESGFSANQMSGISTVGGNVFLELTYSAASTATQFDTFCFYDQIIEINSSSGEVSISR
jgi:hypothetical protein